MKKLSHILASFLLVACAKTTLDYQEVTPDGRNNSVQSFKVTEEEALATLEDFLSCFSNTAPTKADFALASKIPSEIKAIRSQKIFTKTTDEYSYENGIDTLMYVINFRDQHGFAILAADRRTEPILAIIDEGCFDENHLQEGKDDGFLLFLDRAANMIQNDIDNYDETPSTRVFVTNGYTIIDQQGPLLHTKWDQKNVYGSYCPNGIGGCVSIATAQILSYYRTPNSVSWSSNGVGGSTPLHWSQIIADCDDHNGMLTATECATSGDEVAHLVRYLGIAMDADYKSDKTSIKHSQAPKWFNKWSTLSATDLSGFNQTNIVNAIKQNNLVFTAGYAGRKRFLGITLSHTDGHAWVIDGTITASKNGTTSVLFHCNWGWNGEKNGFYLGNAFDTREGALIYHSTESQIGPEKYNFQYKVEYSIISR